MDTTDVSPGNERINVAALFGALTFLIFWLGTMECVAFVYYGHWLNGADLWKAALTYRSVPEMPASALWVYVPPAVAGLVAGILVAIWVYRHTAIPRERRIRGLELLDIAGDRKRIAKWAERRSPGKNAGVAWHQFVPLSLAEEVQQALIIGASGSGKTTVLWLLLQQIIARGDKVLVFSFKGDFQERWPNENFTLLAPWDSRSVHWRLGQDIQTHLTAENFCAAVIPSPANGDPFWSDAARAILRCLVMHLQKTKGDWDFADLGKLTSEMISSIETLRELVMRYEPTAALFLRGEDGSPDKTTSSILMQLASKLATVINLGVAADAAGPDAPRWSCADWLAGKSPAAVIIGCHPETAQQVGGLTQTASASVIESAISSILAQSDVAPDDPHQRVWIIVDEVVQAGKIPALTTSIEALRSKGGRVVLAGQSVRRIAELYSEPTVAAWTGSTGTKILGALGGAADAEWASKELGKETIERKNPSIWEPGSGNRKGHWRTVSPTREEREVMTANEFQSRLGLTSTRGGSTEVRLLIRLSGQKTAAILNWNPAEQPKKQRESIVRAAWDLPNFVRPGWISGRQDTGN
jgi:energy-coupling factor transporter ATP-binding protein EcfA2